MEDKKAPYVSTRGDGSQVNKFEQVFSLGHQTSLAREAGTGVLYSKGPYLEGAGVEWSQYSEVQYPGRQQRSLYDEVQCIMGNGHMTLLVDGKTDW